MSDFDFSLLSKSTKVKNSEDEESSQVSQSKQKPKSERKTSHSLYDSFSRAEARLQGNHLTKIFCVLGTKKMYSIDVVY